MEGKGFLVGGSHFGNWNGPRDCKCFAPHSFLSYDYYVFKKCFSLFCCGENARRRLWNLQLNVSMPDRHHPLVEGGPCLLLTFMSRARVFKAATMPDSGATVCMANVDFINHYKRPKGEKRPTNPGARLRWKNHAGSWRSLYVPFNY
jgi:hypothetical protein